MVTVVLAVLAVLVVLVVMVVMVSRFCKQTVCATRPDTRMQSTQVQTDRPGCTLTR
jgi:Na+-transporting methylmalonyl-CoA/oxaloacetate decarboxylase gamma subunit